MEIGKRIKELRNAKGWNQEVFAEKTFVSRQTVSAWENDKTYPDVKSLLLMSEIFEVSLDDLIKGDIETMHKEINQDTISHFQKWSTIFTIGFIIGILIPYPLVHFFKWVGLAVFLLYFLALFALALYIEKLKKQNNIQTYKEIVAFTEGKALSTDEQIAEKAKRPYQKVLLALSSAALTLAIFLLMVLIFG